MENKQLKPLIKALSDANKAIKHVKYPSISKNLFYKFKQNILKYCDDRGLVECNGYELSTIQPLVKLTCMGYEFHQPYDYWMKRFPAGAQVNPDIYEGIPAYDLEIKPEVLFEDSLNYMRGFVKYYNIPSEIRNTSSWLVFARVLHPGIKVRGRDSGAQHIIEFNYNNKKTACKRSDVKRRWSTILKKLQYENIGTI